MDIEYLKKEKKISKKLYDNLIESKIIKLEYVDINKFIKNASLGKKTIYELVELILVNELNEVFNKIKINTEIFEENILLNPRKKSVFEFEVKKIITLILRDLCFDGISDDIEILNKFLAHKTIGFELMNIIKLKNMIVLKNEINAITERIYNIEVSLLNKLFIESIVYNHISLYPDLDLEGNLIEKNINFYFNTNNKFKLFKFTNDVLKSHYLSDLELENDLKSKLFFLKYIKYKDISSEEILTSNHKDVKIKIEEAEKTLFKNEYFNKIINFIKINISD